MDLEEYIESVFDRGINSGAKSLFWRHSTMNSHMDSICAQATASTPLRHGQRFAFHRHVPIIATIIVLLFSGGPAAITRLVVPIDVTPIQRATVRTLPHVSKESQVTIRPFLAHRYAAPAVVLPILVPWIRTTRLRVAPRPILTRSSLAVHEFAVQEWALFGEKTATTSDFAVDQMASVDLALLTAVTEAQPPRSTARCWRYSSNDYQSLESSASQVIETHDHNSIKAMA